MSSFHSPNRTDFSPVQGPHDLLDFLPLFQKETSVLKEFISCLYYKLSHFIVLQLSHYIFIYSNSKNV